MLQYHMGTVPHSKKTINSLCAGCWIGLFWRFWVEKGPFQRHVCDQKSGKFHFLMATAPGANMLSTSFWLILVLPVRVKTYRSLKIKFFVKVKNKVHVTIGHVCDFARNYVPAPNDFKVKILWCVMEFCIEQYTDDEQHIYKQFHILRMKFYCQDFFWCNILFGHVCDILV